MCWFKPKKPRKRLWITKVDNRIWVCDHFPKFDENEQFGMAKQDGKCMNVSAMISVEESAMVAPKMPVPFNPPKAFAKQLRKAGFRW